MLKLKSNLLKIFQMGNGARHTEEKNFYTKNLTKLGWSHKVFLFLKKVVV